MDIYDNEIPKQIKKKPSTTSKSNKKSNHKHIYNDCLFIVNDRPYKGMYCKICGKISSIKIYEFVRNTSGFLGIMNQDEVYEKYKNLEQIKIENIFQKNIVLTNNKSKTKKVPDDYCFEVGM